MSFVQLTHQIFERFGIIIAIALLVIWAIGTLFDGPGSIHLLLTIGVSMLIWRIVVRGDRAHPSPRKQP